jgi:hypothetical protein
MTVRVSEGHLIIPALIFAVRRGGYVSTAQLINDLEAEFAPEGQDAEILDGRNDTYFSQKVRNLISHRESKTSMFKMGYAEYTGDGIKITDAGRRFLDQVPTE